MVSLNMIDTQGGGIKRLFQAQRRRFFPLPDYDLSQPERVMVMVMLRTTAEVLPALLPEWEFARESDAMTGQQRCRLSGGVRARCSYRVGRVFRRQDRAGKTAGPQCRSGRAQRGAQPPTCWPASTAIGNQFIQRDLPQIVALCQWLLLKT